jgi:hypothetical protein
MTIQKSEHLNELFAALSKLQGKIEKAKKDQAGYKNNYKFADLSQYIDLSQDLLAENGLVVLQLPTCMEIIEITKEVVDDKTRIHSFHTVKIPKQTIITWIGHESGQFISGAMDILVEKLAGMSWGQSTGSAITYGRRYSRAGALGMTQEDDDNQKQPEVKKQSGRTNSKNEPQPKIDINMAQNLAQLLQGDAERLEKTLQWAKASKIEELTVSQYETVLRRIEEDSKAKVEKTEQPATGLIRTILDTSQLIAEHQVNFIKRLVTPERLLKVLQDYKLTRLEEMTIKDFNLLTDALRIEAHPPTSQPKPVEQEQAA